VLLFAWTEPDFQEVLGVAGGGLLTSIVRGHIVGAVGLQSGHDTNLSDALLPGCPRQSRHSLYRVMGKRSILARSPKRTPQVSCISAKKLAYGSLALICLLSGLFASNAAHAQSAPQLVVLGVDVDYTGATLYINGENFTNGGSPVVKLAGTPIPLLLTKETELVASLPPTFMGAVGSYLLTVSTGSLSVHNDVLAVTLGASGPRGPKGDTGPAGLQGLKGDKGDTGAVGPQGLKGDTGPAGLQGLKGDTGNTGPVGPQGLKGDTGAVGPQGLKGDTGNTGPVGPQGPKGDMGPIGLQGPKGHPFQGPLSTRAVATCLRATFPGT
jgi:hypothetical protein